MTEDLWVLIRVLVIIGVLLVLYFPLLPFKSKSKLLVNLKAIRYENPDNKKNTPFLVVGIVYLIVVAFIFQKLTQLGRWIESIPFINKIILSTTNRVELSVRTVILFVIVNAVVLYGMAILLRFSRFVLFDKLFDIKEKIKKKKHKNRKKSDAENDVDSNTSLDAEIESKTDITKDKTPKERNALEKYLCKLFFAGDDFEFVKPWVMHVQDVLQCFLYIAEIVYFILFAIYLAAVFFNLPTWLYAFVNLTSEYVFFYPFIPFVLLQTICDIFNAKVWNDPEKIEEETEDKDSEKRESFLRELRSSLIKKYGDTHHVRYYTVEGKQLNKAYKPSSKVYAKAVEYIGNAMHSNSGHKVQSYLEGLDAAFNDNNVYFSASFYSELGEYLLYYAYIRLLSGQRVIFVVPEKSQIDHLKEYVEVRLNKLSLSEKKGAYRVLSSQEQFRTADVLIACPDDFLDDNIVQNNPILFEEAKCCFFIDADKQISSSSYLCCIIANRILEITKQRARFIFSTKDYIYGFGKSLKRIFGLVDEVLTYSAAQENESATILLWNHENPRIYEKNGQKGVTIEGLIANEAYDYSIDGIRLLSEEHIDKSEKENLIQHDVEINEFHKDTPFTNFLIVTDSKFNLASAIYSYSRFRGKEATLINILSKPYLLREYFSSRIHRYINNSPFVQPRVPEGVNNKKILLLQLLCDATFDDKGLLLSTFERRIREIIALNDPYDPINDYCGKVAAESQKWDRDYYPAGYPEIDSMVGYMFSALGEEIDGTDTSVNKIKSYYRMVSFNSVDSETHHSQDEENDYISFLYSSEIISSLLNRAQQKVNLILNGNSIGNLNLSYNKVYQHYLPGQSITFNNVEYFIDNISDDCKTMYLRHENVTLRYAEDRVFLRKYAFLNGLTNVSIPGVMHRTKGIVSRIEIQRKKTHTIGQTYGYYSLLTDMQTLDFVNGAMGDPLLDKLPDSADKTSETAEKLRTEKTRTEKYARDIEDNIILQISIKSRIECNDGMRLLIAAIFNEFIKSMFPYDYRCVSICPILENPITNEDLKNRDSSDTGLSFNSYVKTLYPFITNEQVSVEVEEKEKGSKGAKRIGMNYVDVEAVKSIDNHSIEFLVVNDCDEDVGIIEQLFDGECRIIYEIICNIADYLRWLKESIDKDNGLLTESNEVVSEEEPKDVEEEPKNDETTDTDEDVTIESDKPTEESVPNENAGAVDSNATTDAEVNSDEPSNEEVITPVNYKEPVSGKGKHFIFFGSDSLPEVFDLDNSLKLLEDCVLLYNENGIDVSEKDSVHTELCSFCHRPKEFGEYNVVDSDDPRFICIDCEHSQIETIEQLNDVKTQVIKYLRSTYPNVSISRNVNVDFMEKVAHVKGEELSDYFYATDTTTKTILVEKNLPHDNAFVSILRGIIEIWHASKEIQSAAAIAQLYYEEIKYLRSIDKKEQADWTFEAIDGELQDIYNDIDKYINEPADTNDKADSETSTKRTSFDFVISEVTPDDDIPGDEEEFNDGDELYDPDLIPRFWKRYLRNEKATGTEEEIEIQDNSRIMFMDNSPWPFGNKKKDSDEDIEEIKDEIDTDDIDDSEDETSVESEDDLVLEDEEDTLLESEDDESESEDDDEDEFEDDDESESEDDDEDEFEDDDESESEDDDDDVSEDSDEDESVDSDDVVPDSEKDDEDKEKFKKSKKQKKNNKVKKNGLYKTKSGIKLPSHEKDEDTNPSIYLYNEIARHIADFNDEKIDCKGLSGSTIHMIYTCVRCDYPEFFWMNSYTSDNNYQNITIMFRCLNGQGKVDVKQVLRKLSELKKASKEFTKGITRKTNQYTALLTIYRRMILKLDYDTIGLNNGAGRDESKDDSLRSLYSALVEHKVVCAGYAAAFQYLAQKVGLCAAYVTSKPENGITHAFNIVKIGRECYFVDATWGDGSRTDDDGSMDNTIFYDYCCVPGNEHFLGGPNHEPNDEVLPRLEPFKATKLEYFRKHNSYVTAYKESDMVRIFVETAKNYKGIKDMGDYCVSFRFSTDRVMRTAIEELINKGGIWKVVEQAQAQLTGKYKKAQKLYKSSYSYVADDKVHTMYLFFR